MDPLDEAIRLFRKAVARRVGVERAPEEVLGEAPEVAYPALNRLAIERRNAAVNAPSPPGPAAVPTDRRSPPRVPEQEGSPRIQARPSSPRPEKGTPKVPSSPSRIELRLLAPALVLFIVLVGWLFL